MPVLVIVNLVIKYLITILASLIVLLNPSYTSKVQAETPPILTKAQPKVEPSINAIIEGESKAYNVSYAVIKGVISCEDPTLDPKQQSNVIYAFSDPSRGIVKGTREQSYGLAMIHLPDHPDITLEEAEDPVFSISYLARSLSEGKGEQWTCYKIMIEKEQP